MLCNLLFCQGCWYAVGLYQRETLQRCCYGSRRSRRKYHHKRSSTRVRELDAAMESAAISVHARPAGTASRRCASIDADPRAYKDKAFATHRCGLSSLHSTMCSQRNHKPLYSHIACIIARGQLWVLAAVAWELPYMEPRVTAASHRSYSRRNLTLLPFYCCSFRAFDETVYARRASSHRKAALPREWLPRLRPFSSTLASEWEPRTLRGFRTHPPRAETQFCFARCTLTRSAPLLRIR